MQVYIEYALAENFCMDFCLLACAKFTVKNICTYRRIALASALGACFAVIYPLLPIDGVLSVAVKIISGLALAALAGRFQKFSAFAKFAAAFLGYGFALGGALIAIFSLAGAEYSAGQGYILSSVPVGIPLFALLMLVLLSKYIARRLFSRARGAPVRCVVVVGDRQAELEGFFDSGNRVYSNGAPVTVIPSSAAGRLVDISSLTRSVKVHTVAGSGRMKIFTADKLLIYNGQNVHTINCVKIGVSPRAISRAVLHPDLSEDEKNV